MPDKIFGTRKDCSKIIFLDRDLVGPSSGEDVAAFFVGTNFAGKVYVTSANPSRREDERMTAERRLIVR